jgi:hypothetical protein
MGCAQSADAAETAPPPTGISDERRQEAIREDKRYSDFVVPEAVLIDTAKCVRIWFAHSSAHLHSLMARTHRWNFPLARIHNYQVGTAPRFT